jgi:hypothetical protein
MTTSIQDMADNIKRNIAKNGFPVSSVALPLERLYESAHRDGLNFNKVLELLDQDGISHSKTPDKIIFSKKPETKSGLNLDTLKNMDFKNMDMSSMMAQAAELMKNMTPSQMAEIKQMYDSMSPDERARMAEIAKSMQPGK